MFEPKRFQRLHSLRKVQNGRNGDSSRTAPPQRLDGEDRFEKSLSSRPSANRIPKIPPVSLEGKKVEVCMSTVWTTKRSTSFYKNHETSTGIAEGKRNKTGVLSGRHTSFVPIERELLSRLRHRPKDVERPRFFNKLQKIRNSPRSKDGVFGDHNKLKENGTECAQKEVEKVFARGKKVQQQGKETSLHHTQAASGFSRQAKLDRSGDGRHGIAYPRIAMGPGYGLQTGTSKSHDVEPKSVVASSSSGYARSRVVGFQSTTLEREVGVTETQPRSCDFDRRLRHRLCGGTSTETQTGDSDSGELDTTRGGHSIYKFKGIGSNFPDGFRFSKTQKVEESKNFSVYRQYGMQMGGEQGYSENNRHVSHTLKNVDLLKDAKYSASSQSYPRSGKCNGRRRESPEIGERRLEVKPLALRAFGPKMGSAHYRLDSQSVKHPTAPILQLDVRPGGDLHRRFEVPPPEGKWVFKSPIFPHRQAPTAGSDQAGHHDSCGSSLENTAMVAGSDKHVRRLSCNVVRHNNITTRFSSSFISHNAHIHPPRVSGGNDHTPPGMEGSRLSYIREELSKQGLPETVLDRLGSAWKPSTVASYESPWSAWQAHCRETGVACSEPSVANFVSFLEKV
jgi:hypothetical protein